MDGGGAAAAPAWGECPCVLGATLASIDEGPTAMSMPPIYNHTLRLTVTEVLRGDLPEGVAIGGELAVSHSARQEQPPAFPAAGAAVLLGAVPEAQRGRMMMMMPGGGEPAAMRCLRLEQRTDEAHAAAVLGCSLPFGWSADGGAVRSPWAALGADAWDPAEGSTVPPAEGAQVCSVSGRPVLECGGALQLTAAMVPPASAADPAAVSKGGKPKGQWPGGWHEWTNPDGDGEYTITLTNTGGAPAAVPALLRPSEGGEPLWGGCLLLEHNRRCYQLPGRAPDDLPLRGVLQPTTLGPGESVSTTVNVLLLPSQDWPRGGSRVEFSFWLGENQAGPVSLYYMSSHHDVLRRELGMETDNYQGE